MADRAALQGEPSMIPEETRIKILEKIYGICYVRKLESKKAEISIPEFKFIIGVYRVKKEEWFNLAKEFEKEKIFTLHYQNPIGVNIKNIIKA